MRARWRLGAAWMMVAVAAGSVMSPPAVAADPPDQVVLVEPDGRWHVATGGVVDYTFWYGIPGDVPLLGDWDGDGFDTPGMYRPDTGFAYLTNQLPADRGVGVAEPSLTFFFGIPGDQVFVGDWDGDGRDSLGIGRRGHIYLSNRTETAFADADFWFGAPADLALGGDPDGDGDDNLFVYRASTGHVYYRTANSSGSADDGFYAGEPTDRFVVGDWDGDGDDTIGLFRPLERRVHLHNTLAAGSADVSFIWGRADWIPVAGRVDLPDE